MTFTLHTLGSNYETEACYFRLTAAQMNFYSPVYTDQRTALQAMKELVLRLRIRAAQILKLEQGLALQLFDENTPIIHQAVYFTSQRMAVISMDELIKLSGAMTFPLIFMELPEKLEEIDHPDDLDFSLAGPRYNWQEVGIGTLRVEKVKPTARGAAIFNPMMSLSPSSLTDPCAPLFSIFQPQMAADLPFFLGRKQEVEELYALSRSQRLILLYGPPRVGKTSLIQCGLANRMEAIQGEMVVHRRGQEDILLSFNETLRAELKNLEISEIDDEVDDPMALLSQLQEKVNRTIFLVFDQLEALFQPNIPEQERYDFFGFIQHLLSDKSQNYQVVLSLREEYLAPIADYEEQLPDLLTNRYRVHQLRKNSMVDVSVNLLDLFKLQKKLNVEEPELVSEKVCEQLANDKGEVPFQCLQIFFQEAHQKSCAESGGKIPALSQNSIDQMGPPRDVIDSYITREVKSLEAQLPQGEGETDPVIQQRIDDLNESRQQCGCSSATTAILPLATAGANTEAEPSSPSIPWLLLLPLLFSIGALLSIYAWMKKQDPCHLAQQIDTCEAYVNYLSEHGDGDKCAAEFIAILQERQCEVWTDYQLIQQTKTCGTYQTYYKKYRNTAVQTEKVQQRLLEWQCPLVRDTVQLTVRDTTVINKYIPTSSSQLGSRINGVQSSAGCQLIDGSNFKKIGPLWMMTEPMEGGPYRWEEALDACNARGWRLPCIGEIEFLINKIYRENAGNAYNMLTGNGDCYLVNPAEITDNRIDFWTGTEANDATSWTFYFNSATKIIGLESGIKKSQSLPCLCVKKDLSNQMSGLPPCYNKTVDRRPG